MPAGGRAAGRREPAVLGVLTRGHFLQVIINFPDPTQKSDIVQLRGPKNEVEKCTKYMQKMVADLVGHGARPASFVVWLLQAA